MLGDSAEGASLGTDVMSVGGAEKQMGSEGEHGQMLTQVLPAQEPWVGGSIPSRASSVSACLVL